jgi:hypothetical protein
MAGQKIIEQQWRSFAERCIPVEAGPMQRQEMRRAFYAGAAGFLTALMDKLAPGQDATDADLKMMISIGEELEQFGKDVVAGHA